MKRKRIFVSMVSLLIFSAFIIAACGKLEKSEEALDDGTSGFSFEFFFWTNPDQKNTWSTEQKRIQKDLVQDGVVEKEWIITKKDLAEVEALVRDNQLTQMKEDIDQYLETTGTYTMQSPPTEFEFSFLLDGKRYIVSYPFGVLKGIPKEDPRYRYKEFFDKLFVILERQKVYKELPASNGGYN